MKKKRIVSILTCSAMLLSMMTPVSVAADSGGLIPAPTQRGYNPQKLNTMVLPKVICDNQNYLVGTQLRNSKANYINIEKGDFQIADTLDDEEEDTKLDSKTTYNDFSLNPNHMEYMFGKNCQKMTLTDPCIADQLDPGGKLYAGFRMTYGYRTMDGNKKNPRPQTNISVNGESDTGHNTHPIADQRFIGLGVYANAGWSRELKGNYLQIEGGTTDRRTFAATKTKDLAIYLLDTEAPHIVSCEITNTNANPDYVKPLDTLTFTLTFSEYIRFADHTRDNAPKLMFQLNAVGVVKDTLYQTAEFKRLLDHQIVFEYTVPENFDAFGDQYKGVKAFTMDGVVHPTDPRTETGKECALKLLPENIADTMSVPADLKSANRITDLAGNALSDIPFEIDRKINFVMTPPQVTGTSLFNATLREKINGMENPYVTAGDSLLWTLYFDRPIKAPEGISITLNAKKDGQNITLSSGAINDHITAVTFPMWVIESGMTIDPIDVNGVKKPIFTVIGVDAGKAKDAAGWDGPNITENIFPNREYQLDYLHPIVRPQTESGSFIDRYGNKAMGIYIKPNTAQFNDPLIFCVPVEIRDGEDGSSGVSGVDQQNGSFYLDGFPEKKDYNGKWAEVQDYSYCVRTDGTLTDEALEQHWINVSTSEAGEIPVNSFEQFSGGVKGEFNTYIYIRINNPPAVGDVNNLYLFLTGQDLARHAVSNMLKIDYAYDQMQPSLQHASDVRVSAGTSGKFNLTQTVTFGDRSGIDWESVEIASTAGTPKITNKEDSADGQFTTFTVTMADVSADTNMDAEITYTVKDKSRKKNTLTKTVPFRYNLQVRSIIEDWSAPNPNGYIDQLILHANTALDTSNAVIMIQVPDVPSAYVVGTYLNQYQSSTDIFGLGGMMNSWAYYRDVTTTESKNAILLQKDESKTKEDIQTLLNKFLGHDTYIGDITYKIVSGKALTAELLAQDVLLQNPIVIDEKTQKFAHLMIEESNLNPDFTVTPEGWSFRPTLEVSMPSSGDALPQPVSRDPAGKSVQVQLSLNSQHIVGLSWEDVAWADLEIKDQKTTFCTIPLRVTGEKQTVTIPDSFHPALDGKTEFSFYVKVGYKFKTTQPYFSVGAAPEMTFELYSSRGMDYLTQVFTHTTPRDPENMNQTYGNAIVREQNFTHESETAQDYGKAPVINIPKQSTMQDSLILCFSAPDSKYHEHTWSDAYQYSWTRVWNATDQASEEANKSSAQWKTHGAPYLNCPTEAAQFKVGAELQLETGLNTLHYQCFNMIDGLSEIHTILVNVVEQPTLGLAVSPDDTTLRQERTIRVQKAQDQSGSLLTVRYYDTAKRQFVEMPAEGLKVRDSDAHIFYAEDSVGGMTCVSAKAEHIDTTPASVQVTWDTVFDRDYHLTIKVKDPAIDEATFLENLYLNYNDAAYTEVLKGYGLQASEEGNFIITGSRDALDSFRPDPCTGILSMTKVNIATLDDGNKFATTQLTLMAPAGSSGFTGKMSVSFVDSAGNQSEPILANQEMRIDPIEVTGLYNGSLTNEGEPNEIYAPYADVSFSCPVTVIEPDPRDVSTRRGGEVAPMGAYSEERTAVPVYMPGTYTMKVLDPFGDAHTVTYEVPEEFAPPEETAPQKVFDGDSLEITKLNTVENGKNIVKVTILSPTGNKFKVSLPTAADYEDQIGSDGHSFLPALDAQLTAGEATLWLPDGKQGSMDTLYSEVELRVTKNGLFKVLIENDCGSVTERLVNVFTNKEAAQLQAVWDYPNGLLTDENGTEYTEDYATVTLTAVDPTRSVVGNSSCTFTYQDAKNSTKTLTVTDDYGIRQEFSVALPVEIRKTEQNHLEPPDLTVAISGERNGKMTLLGEVDAANQTEGAAYSDLIASYGEARKFQLTAETMTPNQTKTILLKSTNTTPQLNFETAQSEAVTGVTISGNMLTVTDASAAFSLVLVDENNHTSPRMDFAGFDIDVTPPTIQSVVKSVKGYDAVEITVTVTDNKSGFAEIVPVSPAGVLPSKSIPNTFVYSAKDNRDISFIFRDRCGNLVQTAQPVAVTEIDKTAPTAKLIAYSPSAMTTQKLPPERTNSDISAYLSFSRNIKELSLEIDRGGGTYEAVQESDGITVTKESENSARVNFAQNGKVRVQYRALNRVAGEPYVIEIADVIDKTAPAVEVTTEEQIRENATKPYAVTITITPTADETYYIGSKALTQKKPFKATVVQNGICHYTIFDEAGNSTVKKVDVKTIDDQKLMLLADTFVTQGNTTTFVLHVSKAAVLDLPTGLTGKTSIDTLGGEDVTITATKSGFHLIRATDQAGNRAFCNVAIGEGDIQPPTILQKTSYVYLRQGSASVSDAALLDQLTAIDNQESSKEIRFTVIRDNLPANFNQIGTYDYVVKAVDEAGNESIVTRHLTVYDRNLVALTVDGAFAKNGAAISAVTGEHAITVSLPEESKGHGSYEPYKVYCTKGYYTAGQMKPLMVPMKPTGVIDGEGDAYAYHFREKGWYTIVVQRQSREVFLTHLLVQ